MRKTFAPLLQYYLYKCPMNQLLKWIIIPSVIYKTREKCNNMCFIFKIQCPVPIYQMECTGQNNCFSVAAAHTLQLSLRTRFKVSLAFLLFLLHHHRAIIMSEKMSKAGGCLSCHSLEWIPHKEFSKRLKGLRRKTACLKEKSIFKGPHIFSK